MTTAITLITIWLLTVFYFVNQAVVKSIKAFLNPDALLEQVEQIDEPFFLNSYQQFNDWAVTQGYQPYCLFLFRIITGGFLNCAVWWNPEQKIWALIYCIPKKINIDFVTQYSEQIAVTTSSSKDAVWLPRTPKAYLQAFTGLSFVQQYAKHQQACQLVAQVEQLSPIQRDLFDSIKNSLKSQAQFIMQLPLWQWRGAYWYFVYRLLKVNKPIKL